MPKRNSVRARTPAEKYRDDVLLGYPEWPTWSRKLRRIFVSLPSYGVGEDALEAMCEDFNWDYTQTTNLVDKNTSFKKAVNEFVDNNYEYRTVTYFNKNKVPLSFQVKWSALQRVYMMESHRKSWTTRNRTHGQPPTRKSTHHTKQQPIKHI